LWVRDEGEVRSELVRPTQLWERWHYHQTGYCPFGIGLRPLQPRLRCASDVRLPLATWAYRPPYLPSALQIDVANASIHPTAPFIFYISAGARPDSYAGTRQQPLEHACGADGITEVQITLAAEQTPADIQAIEQSGLVSFRPGHDYSAAVTFDGGRQQAQLDCRPGIPLVLQW